MKAIQSLLEQVYHPKDAQKLGDQIDVLIKKYQGAVDLTPLKLSEQDVLMISYGDQVTATGAPKLSALKTFLDEYLKDYINLVHLLPFYPYSSDDGFSVIDYYQVNPELGDWAEIEELGQDYDLMFDAVINHISQESDWVKGYLRGDPSYKNFFLEADPQADYSSVTRPRVSPVFHQYIGSAGPKYLWSTFSKDQVDLNYENPQLFLKVLDLLLFYLSKGAKLLRLDAVGFMWKKLGTTCIHLPETHVLIQVMKQVLAQIYPDVVLITETNVPHHENITYFGKGHNEARMVYNFTLPPLLAFSLLQENTQKLTSWARTLKLPSTEVCFFNFTASHDGVGLRPVQDILDQEEISVLTQAVETNEGYISYKSNTDGSKSPYELNCNYFSLLHGSKKDAYGIERFILSQAVMLAMPGLPAIYFHSLIGSENDRLGVERSGRYRSINREKLDLAQLKNELDQKGSQRAIILNRMKELIQLRRKSDCFDPFGSFEIEDLGTEVFCIIRKSPNASNWVKCVFNCSSKALNIRFDDGGMDLMTGWQPEEVIEPFAFRWVQY